MSDLIFIISCLILGYYIYEQYKIFTNKNKIEHLTVSSAKNKKTICCQQIEEEPVKLPPPVLPKVPQATCFFRKHDDFEDDDIDYDKKYDIMPIFVPQDNKKEKDQSWYEKPKTTDVGYCKSRAENFEDSDYDNVVDKINQFRDKNNKEYVGEKISDVFDSIVNVKDYKRRNVVDSGVDPISEDYIYATDEGSMNYYNST